MAESAAARMRSSSACSCAIRVSGAGSGALACTNCSGPMPELTATTGAGVGAAACGGGGAGGGEVIPLWRRARGNRRDGERKNEDKAAHGQEAESILRLEGDVFVGDALLGIVVGRRTGR